MKHLLNMSAAEKVIAWFDLCDFTFSLMRETLGAEKMDRRLRDIHERRLKEKEITLSRLARGSE
jgi:hypothetical protein